VGDTYYAAATSGNNPQAYARYQSKDLKTWQKTGYVFDQWPEWTKGAFWAPEFFVIGNKVMCYYTARQKSDGTSCIGLASAEGPEGRFVDHGPFVRTTNEAIDAFVFNDDGQLYITWKAYGLDPSTRPIEILAQRLTSDGMHLEGAPFMLLRDDERQGMEGQCIFREGKYYYMLYSIRDCCTPQSDYAVSVARSEKFTGPWEKFPGNPILTGNSKDIQSCGHGTLVTTPSGERYYLCHAYYLNRFKEGRKAILQYISMGKDLWPIFGSPETVKAQSRLKVKR
jgi:beta-xylosidase